MPEQKMVDIDTSGNSVDVDIKEEQKQDDVEVQEVQEQDTSVREVKSNEQSNEEDLNEYSDGVKKRIDKLTAKMREAERREQAAIQFADGLKKQYSDLDKKYKDLDTGYLSDSKTELKFRKQLFKTDIKKPYQKTMLRLRLKLKKNLLN